MGKYEKRVKQGTMSVLVVLVVLAPFLRPLYLIPKSALTLQPTRSLRDLSAE